MNLVLDTVILGQLCHPRSRKNQPVVQWLDTLAGDTENAFKIYVAEICDYELRRKLLHLIPKGQSTETSIRRLDFLSMLFNYLPLDTNTMREAARLWADARLAGWPTARESSIDADVILAAQAMSVGGAVVTTNRKHLSRYVPTVEWTDVH